LDKSFTQQDFAKFMADHQVRRKGATEQGVVNSLYDQFVSESCMNYKESRLEIENPEFKTLMEEYRDGILLFELTDRKVWSKAVKDTAGLKEFYEKNKNNYMWPDRVEATIYTCANANAAKETRKWMKTIDDNDTLIARVGKN